MTKQISRNEALERIEFRIRHSCPEANGSNIGDCGECWRYSCNDIKALLVLRDLTEKKRPHGKWEYLKEHITEMRDADGKLNQEETCQFILNLMGVIEREGDEK